MKKIIGFYRKCDLITFLSTILSFCGIVFALENHFTLATIFLLLCGLCDAFDGTVARKYNYSNEQKVYGVELDSLSDVLAFGLFPAFITIILTSYRIWSLIIVIFYLLCGVVRLAYFNMLEITKKKIPNTFIGIPITTVSIVYPITYNIVKIIDFSLIQYVMPILLLILGLLFIINVKIPKPDVVSILKKIFNKYVINFLLIPLALIVIVDLFYKFNFGFNIFNDVIISLENNVLSYLIIYFLLVTFIFLLTCIFGNSKRALIFTFLVTIILLIINDIKFKIMGNPLEISDVAYLNPDNMKMMGEATGTIGNWIYITILKAIVTLILCTGVIFLTKNKIITFKTKFIRVIFLITSLVIFALMLIFINKYRNLLVSKVYHLSNDGVMSIEDNASLYYEYGFSSGILLDFVSGETHKPDGYNKEEVINLLNNINNEVKENNWGKANVVFILSESFTDITNIPELEFNEDVIPNIHKYKQDKNSMVMDLNVNTYGGVSVNTEFEILTGATLSFFRSGFIPYNNYYTEAYTKNAPNIIKEFNNNGYETMYITPWGKDSYHSEYVYNLFGADETKYSVDCVKKGEYCSDMNFMDRIYEELADTNENNLKFIMSATGQNHFPFNYNKYEKYDIRVKNSSMSKENTEMLTSYAEGIYDADKSLNYLYEKIQDLKTPTIIVFFGDHLPYIVNSKGEAVYISSKFYNTDNIPLNDFRKYMTKAVILANYDIKTDDIKYLNANYLGAYVLNKLDLNISDYFKFIDKMRKVLPVFNRNYIYNVNNNGIFNIGDIDANLKQNLNSFKYVQYYSFYN